MGDERTCDEASQRAALERLANGLRVGDVNLHTLRALQRRGLLDRLGHVTDAGQSVLADG